MSGMINIFGVKPLIAGSLLSGSDLKDRFSRKMRMQRTILPMTLSRFSTARSWAKFRENELMSLYEDDRKHLIRCYFRSGQFQTSAKSSQWG